MSADGSFSDAARAAIYQVGSGRCIGCGRPDLTAQHRTARGMGGTSRTEIGMAVNGVPLCGDGIRGCHGWTESNPEWGELLGWRVLAGTDPEPVPFWTRFGWQRWVMIDGLPFVAYVDEVEDLDNVEERGRAVAEFRRALAVREEKSKPPSEFAGPKPTR